LFVKSFHKLYYLITGYYNLNKNELGYDQWKKKNYSKESKEERKICPYGQNSIQKGKECSSCQI